MRLRPCRPRAGGLRLLGLLALLCVFERCTTSSDTPDPPPPPYAAAAGAEARSFLQQCGARGNSWLRLALAPLHAARRTNHSLQAPQPTPAREEADATELSEHSPGEEYRSIGWVASLAMNLGLTLLVLAWTVFEGLKRFVVPRLLRKRNVGCSRLVVRFSFVSISFALQDVVLDPEASQYLDLVNENMLGGYLPCKLDELRFDEFCVTLRTWVLFCRLLESRPTARKLIHRDGGLLHSWFAQMHTAREIEVQLKGVVLQHTAVAVSHWWGGRESLFLACIEQKLRAIEAAAELIIAHTAFGGVIQRKIDQKTKLIRKFLCSACFVVEDMHLTFADATIPLLFTLEFKGLSCRFQDSVPASRKHSKGQLPPRNLLGITPEIIDLGIMGCRVGLERLNTSSSSRKAVHPPCLSWQPTDSGEACFTLRYTKRRRPDQVGKMAVEIHCSSTAKLRLVPIHVELMNRMLDLYYCYTGWSTYVEQRVNSGIHAPPKKLNISQVPYDGCTAKMIATLVSHWAAGARRSASKWKSLVASIPFDVLLYSRLLAETGLPDPKPTNGGKRVGINLFSKIIPGSAVASRLMSKLPPPAPSAMTRHRPNRRSDVAAQVARVHHLQRSNKWLTQAAEVESSTTPMPEEDASIAAEIVSRMTAGRKSFLSQSTTLPRSSTPSTSLWQRLTSVLGGWARSVVEDGEEEEPDTKYEVRLSEADCWLAGGYCMARDEDRDLLQLWAGQLTDFESRFDSSQVVVPAAAAAVHPAESSSERGVDHAVGASEELHSAGGSNLRVDSRASKVQPGADGGAPGGEEVPTKVLELRARQLLLCAEELMYEPPPEAMEKRGFSTDACGMHITIAATTLILTIALDKDSIADFVMSPLPSSGTNSKEDTLGFQFIYRKTRQLKIMQLKLGTINVLDARARAASRPSTVGVLVAPCTPKVIETNKQISRVSGRQGSARFMSLRRGASTVDTRVTSQMVVLTRTQRALEEPASSFLAPSGSGTRWANALSLIVRHTAIVILPDLVSEIGQWWSSKNDVAASDKWHAFREKAARRWLEEEIAPPLLQREDDTFDALLLGGASTAYSISFEGVYCILPSSMKSEMGKFAFCVGLDDGQATPSASQGGSGSDSGNISRQASERDTSPKPIRESSIDVRASAALDGDPMSNKCVPKTGEFLHVSSQPGREAVDFNCKTHMLTILVDVRFLEDGHYFVSMAGLAENQFVLEPTLLRVEHSASLPGTCFCVNDPTVGVGKTDLHVFERMVNISVNHHAGLSTSRGAFPSVARIHVSLPRGSPSHKLCSHSTESQSDRSGSSHEAEAETAPELLETRVFKLTTRDVLILKTAISGLSKRTRKQSGQTAADLSTPASRRFVENEVSGIPTSLDELFPFSDMLDAKIRCHVNIRRLDLECHGEIFQLKKPMLQFTLHSLSSELVVDRRANAARAATLLPDEQAAQETIQFASTIVLEANYLNLNIFELEPLVEPWDVSFYAVNPPGKRVTCGKLYSSRLLHVNMTTALQRTLSDLRTMLTYDGGSSSPIVNNEIRDLASGPRGSYQRRLGSSQIRLVRANDKHKLRWSPPLTIPLTERRVSAHRVWPVGAPRCPHAVVVADVGAARAAGTEVILRSNLTIRNTLHVKVHVLFEELYPSTDDDEDTRVYEVLQPSGTFHVPLHLTSNTRLAVRPFGTNDEHRGWESLSPAFPGKNDAHIDNLSDAQQPNMPSSQQRYGRGRALVCIRHHFVTIQTPTWGPIPDIVLAIVPKFTIENRLPIGIQFRLSAVSRERVSDRNQATVSSGPSPLPSVATQERNDVDVAAVTRQQSSTGTAPDRLTANAPAAAVPEQPLPIPSKLCHVVRDRVRELVFTSPCAASLAASPCATAVLGDPAPLNSGEGDSGNHPARSDSVDNIEVPEPRLAAFSIAQPGRIRRDTIMNFIVDNEITREREEEAIDGLPIGEHCEVLSSFMLEENTEIYLQLRYTEDALESGSEYVGDLDERLYGAAERDLAVSSVGSSGRDPQKASRDALELSRREALKQEATEAAAATAGTWREQKQLLPVLAFERSQMPTTRTQQVAAVGFKRSKASIVRFDLNEQMQVWAELTGGGDSQPVRIILYTDVCLLNQTTLQLAPYQEDKTPLLKADMNPSNSDSRLKPEALYLLCCREKSHRLLDKLRLKVTGVNATTTRNQQLDFDGEEFRLSSSPSSGSNIAAGIAEDQEERCKNAALGSLRICEPHERILLDSINDSFSSPILTKVAYYGEAWLDGARGILGVNTRLQPQELVPSTAIIAIKPRFVLVNRLAEPVQFFPTSARLLSEGEALRLSNAPAHLTDVIRPSSGSLSAEQNWFSRHLGEEIGDLPEELQQLSGMPAAPPAAVTPIYTFNYSNTDVAALRIYLRVATQDGTWSVPLPLNEARTFYFFAEKWRGSQSMQAAGPPRLIRVSIHEQVPTVFITVEDATLTPPSCIRNDTHDQTVWYSIWFNEKQRENWHKLKPGRKLKSELQRRSDLSADIRQSLLDYHSALGVSIVWYNSQPTGASGRGPIMKISIRMSDPEAEEQDYDSLLRNSGICEFDFSELYRVQEIQPSAKSDGVASSVYGRVRMHENLPNTRLLLVSSLRERREQIDEEIDQMLEAREARDSVDSGVETKTFRQFLPSALLERAKDSHARLAKSTSASACAIKCSPIDDPWHWVGFEVNLHGISVALIDSTPSAPSELLQLNLRGIRFDYVESKEIGMRCDFTLRNLSIDNLLPDNYNPVLLDAAGHSEIDSFDRDSSQRGAMPSLAITIDRRGHFNYRSISAKLAPVRLVLDLSLLKALSRMGSSGTIDHRGLEIACSPRLRMAFNDLRAQGITLPTEMIRLEEVDTVYTYLKHVKFHSMELHITVAMASTYVSDPTKDLLEMIEILLPQVPRALEPVLPVLSNLANVTDATFHVKPYETKDSFTTSIVQVVHEASSFWAAQLMRIFLSALGSMDMFGNPFGLLRRVQTTTVQAGKHAMEGVRTRNVESFGKMVIELLHGFIGGSADSLSKMLRSLHGCVSTLGLTTSHNRRLVARERPRDILQGIEASRRVLCTTIADACQSVYTTPCQSGKRGGTGVLLKQLGASTCQCLASPLTGLLGSMAVLLSSVDSTTRKLTARKEMQRSRPPRIFEPGLPRLFLLQDNMVVRLQIVLESVHGVTGLGMSGTLKVTVQLISGRDSSYIIESHSTREINWPRVRQWEEVVSLKPDAMDDEIVLQLSHSVGSGPLSHTRIVGEARMRVCDVNDEIVKSRLAEMSTEESYQERDAVTLSIGRSSARSMCLSDQQTRPSQMSVSTTSGPVTRGIYNWVAGNKWRMTRHAAKAVLLERGSITPSNRPLRRASTNFADAAGLDDAAMQKHYAALKVQTAMSIWQKTNMMHVYDLAVLRVKILHVSKLPNLDAMGTSDPYCVFTIEGKHTNLRRQTKIGRGEGGRHLRAENGTLNVWWGQHFDCFVRLEPGMRLTLQVLDQDMFTPHRLIAKSRDLHLNHNELSELAINGSPPIEKRYMLYAPMQKGELGIRSCELSVSFEARVVPQRYETEAKGRPKSCKLLRPAVQVPDNGIPALPSSGSAVGTLNVRFKAWDGTRDEDLDNALWKHWAMQGRQVFDGPRDEAARVLEAVGRGL